MVLISTAWTLTAVLGLPGAAVFAFGTLVRAAVPVANSKTSVEPSAFCSVSVVPEAIVVRLLLNPISSADALT
ncbi:MAG: hypothetical protein WDN49_12180 [Acetobacteraceae bacterium]